MFVFLCRSESFVIGLTGGSIKIFSRKTKSEIKTFSGYKCLYTGGIKPDESECFALENGKHFYVYSLKTLELIKRVTLPKSYVSVDVYGFYSHDGKVLNIPAHRYIFDDKYKEFGHYEYVLCKYETDNYTLIEKMSIPDKLPYLISTHEGWCGVAW